ncbi:hypothetical protein [Luteibacter aegosomatissinici]|uniref:hypothetical protein n=1 Tax=Luteibacter aegosomatissinici TaxID=2911539 RepID=UPI001FF8800D|nr:hypothetical protein [Luteibacter aegosomatissinici]UPG96329.1 hypothetical protein L2Y97_09535 [Luteibacter aegosomatissinici]
MKQIILAGLCLAVVGCATGEKVRRLDTGMDRQAVERQLGRPDGFSEQEGYQVLTYKNRLMSGWSWDRADYQVLLKDGLVVQYGPGEVRHNQPNSGLVIVAPAR